MAINSYAPHDPDAIYSAESLAALGYQVTLIGTARLQERPVPSHSVQNGVTIRIAPFVASWRDLPRAVWDWLRSTPGAQVQANARAVTGLLAFVWLNLWVLRWGFGGRFGVVHCHDVAPLPACWLLAKLKRAKLIYHARENAVTLYGDGARSGFSARIEATFIGQADAVISAGLRLAPQLEQRGARRVLYIGNWKRLADYDIAPERLVALRQQHGIPDGALLLVYIGTLDPTRELAPLLEAVRLRPDVHLLIGGRGLIMDSVIAAAEAAPNIHWLGWVDLADVPLYSCAADALYCCLEAARYKEQNVYTPAANKLFEAFAAGVPLIAVRGVNEMADILEATGAGLFVDEVTPSSLIALFDLLRNPQAAAPYRAAARAARSDYHWGKAEAILAALYQEVLA